MKSLQRWVLLPILIVMAGCATGEWQSETIPYPSSTPFDSNPFARRAYLDGFATGYRSEKRGEASNVDVVAGTQKQARRLGIYAGAATARGEANRAPAVKP